MRQHITRISILPPGEPIFSERGYTVEIDDEAAGPFLVVKDGQDGQIKVDFSDWNEICEAVNHLKSEASEIECVEVAK